MKRVNDKEIYLNNAWVMSYNSYLTRKYNVYINVEVYDFI